MKECEHEEILYNKIEDYNYCSKCKEIIFEDLYTIIKEEEKVIDDYEDRLEELNKL